MQGVLPLAVELQTFGSPGGLQIPNFSKCWASPPHLAKLGLRHLHLLVLMQAYELNEKNNLSELVNSRLNIENNQMILNVIHIGLLCVQIDPSFRPSMAKVMAMLKSEVKLENWENVKVSKTSYSNQYLNSEGSTINI
jgi:hypothetical protein